MPIQPIQPENGPNGLNWQCCLAGSSKTAPRILIFSTAIELISIETYVSQFIGRNKIFLGSVKYLVCHVKLKIHFGPILPKPPPAA